MESCGVDSCRNWQPELNPLKECLESGVSCCDFPDGLTKDEQEASSPRDVLQKGGLGTSTSSDDSRTSYSSEDSGNSSSSEASGTSASSEASGTSSSSEDSETSSSSDGPVQVPATEATPSPQASIGISGPTGIMDGKEPCSPTSVLYKDASVTSSSSEDEVQFRVAEAALSPQASISISSPAGVMQEAKDATSQPGMEVVSDGTPLAASAFPGFVETEYSNAEQQYFYKDSRKESRFGSGSFGVVRRVHWLNPETGELDLYVAKSLEVVRGHTHPGGLVRWQADAFREVTVLCSLAGVRGVPGFQDMITETDGTIHIIMGNAPGKDLPMRMWHRQVYGWGLSWQQIRTVLLHLAQVLADCHERGIVHGDIKLAHVISDRECQVTLIDFGSASLWDGSGWKHHGGTVVYAAPELLLAARSKPAVDAPSLFMLHGPPVDLWAYGVMSFELLTGCCLFQADKRAAPDYLGEVFAEWQLKSIADLHEQWEAQLETSSIHATFQEKMELLAEASEEYKLAGMDFLRGLLHPDPNMRLTARDAIRHPFLAGTFPDIDPKLMPSKLPEEDVEPKNTLERLLYDAIVNMCKRK